MAAVQLASAFVRVGVKGVNIFGRTLANLQGMVMSAMRGITGMITSVGAQLAAIGGGISFGFAVKAASDAEEMRSKFQVVFGEMSEDAEKFSKDFAGKVGRSVNDTMEQMSGFQDILVPLGFARKDASELSKTLTQMAVDMASFNNKTDKDASEALIAALTGERERLKSLGVVLRDEDVKARLAAKGQEKLTGEARKQAVALATLELVRESAADAMGDAERTAGSFANRIKALGGVIKDTAAIFGSTFTPALAEMAKMATDFLKRIQPRIQEFADKWKHILRGFVMDWDNAWGLIKDIFKLALSAIWNYFKSIPEFFLFAMGRMIGYAMEYGPKIGEQLWKAIKAGFTGTDVESVLIDSINDLSNAFHDGLDMKKTYNEFVKEELLEGTEELRDKIKERMAEAFDLSSAMDKAKQDVKKASQDVAQEHKAVIRASLSTGFTDLVKANQQIQESLLKEGDKTVQLIAAAKHGNAIQERIAQATDKMVLYLSRSPQPGVATP